METIDAKQLRARLTSGDPLSLVMFMDRGAYERAHIAGSIQCDDAADAARRFAKDTTIVGYCSSEACFKSKRACNLLVEQGFSQIIHFEGGLWAWQEAGYEVEASQ